MIRADSWPGNQSTLLPNTILKDNNKLGELSYGFALPLADNRVEVHRGLSFPGRLQWRDEVGRHKH